jgi:TetR/AcrR family transcriptional regulator, transcriptional repressor for nem operon
VQRVLDAACTLFSQRGVRATTLDEIGAAAGVGRGQLYHFFAGKADLVADVVALQVDRVITSAREFFDTMTTPADVHAWCAATVDGYAAATEAIRCPIGSLINELDQDTGPAREALQAGFVQWEDLMARGLQRVADHGGLTVGTDVRALAGGLLAAFQGGVLLADISGGVDPLRRALEIAIAGALAPTTTSAG